MLRNKNTLYVLFPLVVIIWGLLVYRLLAVVTHEPETFKTLAATPTVYDKLNFKRDTFTLQPVKRDPFLGHAYIKHTPKKSTGEPVKKNIQWPPITYLGQVSDTGRSSAIYILEINGKQFLMEPGNVEDQVKVVSANNERLTVVYKGVRKVYLKTH